MPSSTSMSRASRPLLVIASLLAVAGCVTTPPEPSSGREAASDVLSRAIGDGTQLVGFTIGADVLLLEGRDTRQRRLFPVEQKSGEAISSTQSGPWVLGRDFDLPASLARADEQLDRCEGGGRVSVRVLSPEATLTTTDCGDDSHVLLNDAERDAPLGQPHRRGARLGAWRRGPRLARGAGHADRRGRRPRRRHACRARLTVAQAGSRLGGRRAGRLGGQRSRCSSS